MQAVKEQTERIKNLEDEKTKLQDEFSVEQDVVATLQTQITDQEDKISQKVSWGKGVLLNLFLCDCGDQYTELYLINSHIDPCHLIGGTRI